MSDLFGFMGPSHGELGRKSGIREERGGAKLETFLF